MERVILWDFDGTLAERPGLWGACLLEILDEHAPGHGVPVERLGRSLRDGFPWHRPETAHPELCAPGAWWRHVELLIAAAYRDAGLEAGQAALLAGRARERYVDSSRGWTLFRDTKAALRRAAVRVPMFLHVEALQSRPTGV